MVVFATSATTPYVDDTMGFSPGQKILNISLRDLAPELVLGSNNIFDDVDHCLKANTSPHLAEMLTNNRQFVTGNLAELIRGQVSLDPSKPTIYSPFGMGILDIALGKIVFDEACKKNLATKIHDFHPAE